MFKYPLTVKEVMSRGFHGSRAIIEADFEPSIGSMVPLDLFPFATHSIWYVYKIVGKEIHLHTDRLEITNHAGLLAFITEGGKRNTLNDDQECEINKYVHEVINELRRAEKKFPNWNSDAVYAAAILGEESGETMQAALDFQQAPEFDESLRTKIVDEAIQTGAMSIRLLINAHRFERVTDLFELSEIKTLRTMLDDKASPKAIADYLYGLTL